MSNVLRLFSTANEFHFHFLLAKPQIEEEVEKDNMLRGLNGGKVCLNNAILHTIKI